MENIITATETIWWIVIALLGVLVSFAIFTEIFRNKNIKGKYLSFIPISFCFGYGITVLAFSLIFVWWVALPISVLCFFLVRMEEKAEITRHFKRNKETIEDYKQYQSNVLAMSSSGFMSFLIGVVIKFYFELVG